MSVPTDKPVRSERELLEAARQGDQGAFVELCTLSLPELVDFLHRRSRRFGLPLDLVDDIAQETILRVAAYPSEDKVKAASDPRAKIGWLITIARNLLYDQLRAQGRTTSVADEQLEEIAVSREPSADALAESADVEVAVREKFGKLSPKDQEILEMILLQGYDPKEAAVKLQIGAWAARKRLQRALQRLRKLLEKAGISYPLS